MTSPGESVDFSRASENRAATSGRFGATIIFLLTLVYLCLELPFSVDLLNGVGRAITPSQLQRLEIAGRLISGLALVLLIWQFVVVPLARTWRRGRMWTIMACLLISVPVMVGVYLGEGAIVTRESSYDGAAARQMALVTVLFAQGVENGQVAIKGLPFTSRTKNAPDALAFMALLPLMTSQMHDVRARLGPVANNFVKQRLEAETGGAEAFYKQTYVPAIQRAQEQYARYRKGIQVYDRGYERYHHMLEQYEHLMDSARQHGDQEYWAYRKQLARAIHSPGPVAPDDCPAIRVTMERRYGIQLPSDWNCWAKAPFAQAVEAHIRDEARRNLNDAQRELLRYRPSDMGATFHIFLNEPKIRQQLMAGWKRAGVEVPSDAELENQTVASWNALVYQPMLDSQTNDIVSHFSDHLNDFRRGGSFYVEGRAAHELLMIPAIALFFSLIGALIHIVKILVEFSVIACPRKAVHWRKLAAGNLRGITGGKLAFGLRVGFLFAGILLVSIPAFVTTPVTRSRAFESITQAMRTNNVDTSRSSIVVAAFAKWAIQTESVIYPFNAKLRNAVDNVFDFDQSWLVRVIAKHSTPLSSPLGGG
ncbi:hypothetical protein [Metallibacterium scheffleri]